ncbi:hypothetical protein F4806DRAFT_233349 [Annulohypoxylon nitens]|nr:hypothetical protein F4806DRAFT_233349 [Annulohypoxylon nitens]
MLYLILFILRASLASDNPIGYFSNPSEPVNWTIGDIQEIQFTVNFTTLSIALWQQDLHGESAGLGPVIFQAENSKTEFGWQVQTYDFSLDKSNKFFFWVFEGDSSQQDNFSRTSLSSTYFYIVDGSASSSSSTVMSTMRSTSTITAASSSPTVHTDAGSGSESELNVGAKAAIGISAGLIGIATIFGTRFLFRKLKRQPQSLVLGERNENLGELMAPTPRKPGPFELS